MKTPYYLCLAFLLALASTARAVVTIEYVTVGDAGNAADLTTGGLYGAVAYTYNIGKYEVTNAQYAEFLNAADPGGTNPNTIYNANMGSNARGGISFDNLAASGSKYAVKTDMGDKPVNYVSFTDAMRFTNWINNGQGNATTESGAYDMSTPAHTVIHSGLANVWLPTENEWYKAAYYQPAGAGGDTDSYWLYPAASNAIPTVAAAGATGIISNPGANVANHNNGADWNSQNGNVTTVGSAGTTSYYGAYDLGGNVYEWNEAIISTDRGVRGGAWDNTEFVLRASNRGIGALGTESRFFGFRLAGPSVPEPSRVMLLLAGAGAILMRRRRLPFAL